jgi:hypothetical protein
MIDMLAFILHFSGGNDEKAKDIICTFLFVTYCGGFFSLWRLKK